MDSPAEYPSSLPASQESDNLPIRTRDQERRAQPRSETVLSRIEDATYTILRRYQNTA
jgi:RNA polymerase-binding transcription factor DksA